MPRAGGVYTLPAGNPVVTLTAISSAWANTTMSDIATALTGSVPTDGSAPMTGALRLVDGAVGTPGLTWATETTSGLYRIGAGDFGFSIAGTKRLELVSAGTLTVFGSAIQFISRSSVARGGGTNWLEFDDPTGSKGYVGYGLANDTLQLQNQLNAALTLGTNNVAMVTIAAAGNVTIAAPSAGDALTVTQIAGAFAIRANQVSNANPAIASVSGNGINAAIQLNQIGAGAWNLYVPAGTSDFRINNTVSDRITITNPGNVSIAAPTAGVALTVTGVAGSSALQILGTGVQVGAPTGGDQGLGTLNATGLFVNGVAGAPQNSQAAAYQLVLADAGKSIYHPAADAARIWTIPANGTVAFPIGTMISFDNDISAGSITISITTDTLVFVPSGTTGSRVLANGGQATARKITATRWMISGVGLT